MSCLVLFFCVFVFLHCSLFFLLFFGGEFAFFFVVDVLVRCAKLNNDAKQPEEKATKDFFYSSGIVTIQSKKGEALSPRRGRETRKGPGVFVHVGKKIQKKNKMKNTHQKKNYVPSYFLSSRIFFQVAMFDVCPSLGCQFERCHFSYRRV